MICLYRLLHILLSPIVFVYLVVRLITKKEDFKRIKERLGQPSIDRDSSKRLIWIHCASVGESISVLPIVKRLARLKNTNVLVTTGTVTSANLMNDKLPKNSFHQYIPIDSIFAVKKFMAHWKPDMSIFVESDLWPNLVDCAPNKILINARMSDRSFKRYSKFKLFAKILLNKFDVIYAQSQQDFNRFSSLTTAKVVNAGNIKYDGNAPDYKKTEYNVLSQAFEDRKVLVVASTHKTEDEKAIEIYTHLKKQHNDLLMVLVPRHPHRGDDIASLLASGNLNYTQRSKTKGLENSSLMDVYLADTLGEIGLWYALANVVVMGGSLIPHGGHNPLEPLKAGKPTYSGKYMHNFKDMTDLLTSEGVLFVCEDQEDLISSLNNALLDESFFKEFSEKAASALDKMTGATEFIIKEVKDNLKLRG